MGSCLLLVHTTYMGFYSIFSGVMPPISFVRFARCFSPAARAGFPKASVSSFSSSVSPSSTWNRSTGRDGDGGERGARRRTWGVGSPHIPLPPFAFLSPEKNENICSVVKSIPFKTRGKSSSPNGGIEPKVWFRAVLKISQTVNMGYIGMVFLLVGVTDQRNPILPKWVCCFELLALVGNQEKATFVLVGDLQF